MTNEEAAALPCETLGALYELYDFVWNRMVTYDGGNGGPYSLVPWVDQTTLEEICKRIEPHETAIQALLKHLDEE